MPVAVRYKVELPARNMPAGIGADLPARVSYIYETLAEGTPVHTGGEMLYSMGEVTRQGELASEHMDILLQKAESENGTLRSKVAALEGKIELIRATLRNVIADGEANRARLHEVANLAWEAK